MKWLGCAAVGMILVPMFLNYRPQPKVGVVRTPPNTAAKHFNHQGPKASLAGSKHPEQLQREEAHLKLLLIQASMRNQGIAPVVATGPMVVRK